jgi:putative FmdB family regulatory protein
MPIYEYACPKCGEFEQRQSLSDPVLKKCPTCRSKVTKLISTSAFTLKGGGWYSDAYQKKSSSSPSSPSSPANDTAKSASTETSGSSSTSSSDGGTSSSSD